MRVAEWTFWDGFQTLQKRLKQLWDKVVRHLAQQQVPRRRVVRKMTDAAFAEASTIVPLYDAQE